MRSGFVTSAIALLCLLPKQASSCEMISVRRSLAEPESPRVVGRVTGYGEELRPVQGVERAVSLQIAIESVISGRAERGQRSVVPLFYGANCSSMSMKYDDVVQRYPVGALVAVSSSGNSPARRDAPIVVEQNQGGFVIVLPAEIRRTADGDLDFARFDPSQEWLLGEFEFDRAVLALRAAGRSQRFRRMVNLASYRGFHEWPQGRTWLDALISESRLSRNQRAVVLDAFRTSDGALSPKP
jgi:hypothetical protein